MTKLNILGTEVTPGETRNDFCAATQLRVALVVMPWSSVTVPSLAVGILKQIAMEKGHHVEVFYLNMLLAQRLGFALYEEFAKLPLAPEWFFAPGLHANAEWPLSHVRAAVERELQSSELAELVRIASRHDNDPVRSCLSIALEHAPQYLRECFASANWPSFDVVGFTTTFAQTMASLSLAKAIKQQHPTVKIVFGGANVDGEMGGEILKGFRWIDYVVHGEAEVAFPRLLRHLSNERANATGKDDVPSGISWRSAEGDCRIADVERVDHVDLDNSPVPDFSDYVYALGHYGHRNRVQLRLYYESSRGCWWGARHHCTFCGLNGTYMAFRRKRPDKVFGEILQLSQRYRCLSFFFCDNILAPDYFSTVLPELAKEDIDFHLFYEVKANLTKRQLALLSNAGVRDIQPGIESLNSRLLKLMNKGITAIQNIQLLKWCRELSIVPLWNLLYGFPGERLDDYAAYPSMFELLSHLQPPAGFIRVVFERFSPYHYNSEAYGLTLAPCRLYERLFAETAVDTKRVAYYFDGQCDGAGTCTEGDMREMIELVEEWRQRYAARETHCIFSKGEGFLLISDSRASGGWKQYCLEGPVAKAYEYCDENRSFGSILRFLTGLYDGKVCENTLRKWLSQLVDERLMFEEGDRYLSLAVRSQVTDERHW